MEVENQGFLFAPTMFKSGNEEFSGGKTTGIITEALGESLKPDHEVRGDRSEAEVLMRHVPASVGLSWHNANPLSQHPPKARNVGFLHDDDGPVASGTRQSPNC